MGVPRYNLQPITSARVDDIIYIIHTHLKGITSPEVDALSSAGNVEAFRPGTILVAPSNDVAQGRTRYLSIGHMSKHMLIGGINALPYSPHMPTVHI